MDRLVNTALTAMRGAMARRVGGKMRHHPLQPLLDGNPYGFIIVQADDLSLPIQAKAHRNPDQRRQRRADVLD